VVDKMTGRGKEQTVRYLTVWSLEGFNSSSMID